MVQDVIRDPPLGPHINQYGVAEVDREKCTCCMQCAAVCPRKVIVSMPYNIDIVVPCANKETGAAAKSHCSQKSPQISAPPG